MKIIESPMKVTYFMLQLDVEDFQSTFKDALKLLVPPRARSYSGGSRTFYISNIYRDRVEQLIRTYEAHKAPRCSCRKPPEICDVLCPIHGTRATYPNEVSKVDDWIAKNCKSDKEPQK